MFAAFLSTLLFSVSVICGHRSAKLIGGSEANFWRLALAALFLGTWSFAAGVGLGGAAFPMFLLSGVVGIGVGDVGLFQALPRLGSRLSMLLIHCLGAPFAALIEWLWLKTPLTGMQIICGVLILIGVGIALSPGTHLKLGRRELVPGVAFALLAALGNAFGGVLSRKAYSIAHENLESISGHDAAFQRIAGGLAVAGICLVIVKIVNTRGVWNRGRIEERSVIHESSSQNGGLLSSRGGEREQRTVAASSSCRANDGLHVDSEEEATMSELSREDLDSSPSPPEEERAAERRPSDPQVSDLHKVRQKWLRVGPWVLANSLAGQTLGVSSMQKAFETTPTGLVLSIIAMTPIVVMPLAYLFEGEKATRRSIVGGVVAVCGVILLVANRR